MSSLNIVNHLLCIWSQTNLNHDLFLNTREKSGHFGASCCNCAICNDRSYSLSSLNSRCEEVPTITLPLLWIIMHSGQHISAHLSSCWLGAVQGAGMGVFWFSLLERLPCNCNILAWDPLLHVTLFLSPICLLFVYSELANLEQRRH